MKKNTNKNKNCFDNVCNDCGFDNDYLVFGRCDSHVRFDFFLAQGLKNFKKLIAKNYWFFVC